MMEDKSMKPLRIYKASAGSGKTFTLAVEYISLLAVNPMAYQNILAVTFTNKATAEMKQRILATLYGIANGLTSANDYIDNILQNLEARKSMPPYQEEPYRSALTKMNRDVLRQRAKEALSNIIHDYSRFHIETIDSFFQSIVREIASELELSTKMKVELDETEVLSDAIDQIIENLREGSSEFRTIIEFIEEKIRENRSWQVEETVKEFGRCIFKENYLIHGEDVRQKITDFNAIFKYKSIINNLLEEKKSAVIEVGKKMLEAWENCGMTEKDGSKTIFTFMEKVRDYRITEPTTQSPGTFSDAIGEYRENVDKWFKKTSKNRDVLQPQVERMLMPLLSEAFERHTEYVSHLHTVTAITQHLYSLMLLNEISQTVKSLNENSNRFLLSETANFLRNVMNNQDIPFIYEKTGAVIKHIMIDEFQDTSTLQWGNFKPLILNSLSMDGSCLIVGDVKQSIYRFRNSDWQILNGIEKDKELKNYMEHIPATFNFRSSKRVVDFNNELFKNAIDILKEDCPALSTAYGDVHQIAKKSQEAGFVRIENIDYHNIDPENLPEVWDKETSEKYDEATLQRIQLSVKELIDNGVNANDITILIRTNKEVPLISDYFNSHQEMLNVKVVSDDAFRLDASPAINLIIDAMRVLAAQDDKLHLTTLEHHYGKPIPNGFNLKARQEMQFKSLTELTEEIYQIFHLDELPNQDAYLFFFNDIVEQFCEDNMTDLDTFLQAWDEKLCEKTIPNGASEGVRIMTMHKSKGLEFHSVIIPSCSWSIKPNDKEVMWCMPNTAPYNQMPLLPISVNKAKDDSIFAADRREEELRTLVDNINVLYVAFTRAKHNLIILTGNKIGKTLDIDGKVETAQSFLIKSMPEQMEQTDVEGVIMQYQMGKIVGSKHEKEENHEQQKERNVMECEYDALPVSFVSHPSVAEFRQSYESDLFITEDSPHPKTQQHSERIRLISLGNLYHAIFERIRTVDDVPHAVRLLESKGCFGTLLDAQEAREAVSRMIEDIMPEHPEWFSPDWQALNERAILFLENHMLVTKRPDRVIVNGNQAIIIDYKTAQGVVRQKADGTFVPPSENKKQIDDYKRLLAQIGYTEVKAFLWYILDSLIVPI
ncbi:MAG: UvrD-helicase domain-containing protein [Bacteroidaceae bacterium]|nr:UvrD-helicase domain-containing protein [Bacteroidaceae bacterium]